MESAEKTAVAAGKPTCGICHATLSMYNKRGDVCDSHPYYRVEEYRKARREEAKPPSTDKPQTEPEEEGRSSPLFSFDSWERRIRKLEHGELILRACRAATAANKTNLLLVADVHYRTHKVEIRETRDMIVHYLATVRQIPPEEIRETFNFKSVRFIRSIITRACSALRNDAHSRDLHAAIQKELAETP